VSTSIRTITLLLSGLPPQPCERQKTITSDWFLLHGIQLTILELSLTPDALSCTVFVSERGVDLLLVLSGWIEALVDGFFTCGDSSIFILKRKATDFSRVSNKTSN